MRYWKFCISCLALFFISFFSFANTTPIEYCGGSYEYRDTYYPILDQHLIEDPSFWPFLYCPYNDLCEDRAWDGTSDNVAEWQEYLGGNFSAAEVTQLIYEKEKNWYEALMRKEIPTNVALLAKKIAGKKFKGFVKYMVFAKKNEGLRSNGSSFGRGWYQGENNVTDDPKSELLATALKLVSKEKDPFLKNRYGFQIVRLSHYLEENTEAVRYFKKLMHLTPETRYSYYLALEQKSGAAYNLNEVEEAAEGFLTVYDELPSRRKSCALSLRHLDWSAEELKAGVATSHPVSRFFKAYHARGDVAQEMLALEGENSDSPYLEVLVIREVDKIQQYLFAHTSDYWGTFQKKEKPKTTEVIGQIADRQIKNTKVANTDFWRLVQSVIALDANDTSLAKRMVSAISKESPLFVHAKRIDFAISVHSIKDIDRSKIEMLFKKLKTDAYLYEYAPLSGFFFNHVASLYVKEGNYLMGDFGYIPYYDKTQNPLTWQDVTSSLGNSLKLEWKHNYVDEIILKEFQKTVALFDKTEYEQLVLSQLKADPEDYLNELKGTWYLWENDLDNAIATLEKIKSPEVFYGDDIRTMLFSRAAITEYFDTTFMAQNDGTHLEFSEDLIRNSTGEDVLFDEYYKDNKLLLAKNLRNLEQLAEERPRQAAIYCTMLGNAWYNMGKTGWFLNTLHYVGNDSRNQIQGDDYVPYDDPKKYTADKFTKNASHYFEKVLEVGLDNEVKAQATFMLARTKYSFEQIDGNLSYRKKVRVLDEHRSYFEQLRDIYGDTDFVKYTVIDECSWYRSFLE